MPAQSFACSWNVKEKKLLVCVFAYFFSCVCFFSFALHKHVGSVKIYDTAENKKATATTASSTAAATAAAALNILKILLMLWVLFDYSYDLATFKNAYV